MARFRRSRFVRLLSALAALALLPVGGALAQTQQAASGASAPQVASGGEGWQLTVTPFAWGAEQRGDIVVRGVEASADIDLSDILDAADAVAALGFELHNGDFAFQVDALYLDVEEDVAGRFLRADVGLEQVIAQSFLSYRALSEPVSLEFQVGARYSRLEASLDFATLPIDVDQTRDWVDPLVGMRVRTDLTERLAFAFRGDVGGFGVGSDRMWAVNGSFIYALADRWNLTLGYNLLSCDYDDGSGSDRFEYNLKQRGPVFAVSYRF